MSYIIVGLKENGDMTIYDRGCEQPTVQALEAICRNYDYTQVVVAEDRFAGYAQRYVYDLEPKLREVPLRGVVETAEEEERL